MTYFGNAWVGILLSLLLPAAGMAFGGGAWAPPAGGVATADQEKLDLLEVRGGNIGPVDGAYIEWANGCIHSGDSAADLVRSCDGAGGTIDIVDELDTAGAYRAVESVSNGGQVRVSILSGGAELHRDDLGNGGWQINSALPGVQFYDDIDLPIGSKLVASTVQAQDSGGITIKDSGGNTKMAISAGGVGITQQMYWDSPLSVQLDASGAIVRGSGIAHIVEANSGTADDLDSINSGVVGQILMIYAAPGETLSVRDDGTSGGNIATCGDTTVVLTDTSAPLFLAWSGDRSTYYQMGCDS